MMRLLSIFLLFPIFIFGQQSIDADEFTRIGLSGYQPADSNINPEKVRFSWLNGLEVRSQTRDFELKQQEYTLRISPSTRGIRKEQSNYYHYLAAMPNFEQQAAYCDRLQEVYSDWLKLYFANERTSLFTQLQAVYTDQQTVMERLIGSLDLDYNKIIKIRSDQSELLVNINNEGLEQRSVFQKYDLNAPSLDFQTMLDISAIGAVLSGQGEIAVAPDEETNYELGAVQREIALEKAETRQWLDFVQFRYRGPHENPLEERMSVGIGFQLPYSGSQKLKILELEIESEQKQQELALEIQNQQNALEAAKIQLLTDIESLQFLEQTAEAEREELEKIANQITTTQGFNPMLLLQIEERKINSELEALKLREEIFFDFLDYLDESGDLCSDVYGVLSGD